MTRVVFSSGWKLSRDARGIFQLLEKQGMTRVVFSSGWKPSRDARGIFPGLETFL